MEVRERVRGALVEGGGWVEEVESEVLGDVYSMD